MDWIHWLEKPLVTINTTPLSLWGVIKGGLCFAFAILLARFLLRLIKRYGSHMEESSFYVLKKLIYYSFIALGFVFAFHSAGFDLTLFTVFFGAIFVWLGFSLQPIFHNFLSGILLLMARNIKVGDKIMLETKEVGIVKEIYLMVTVLHTENQGKLIIPNSELSNKKVIILPK